MSISYSGIIGNKAKNTTPSVESWGTNNNILRDPPKSIMTRRIDKVNQDGSLNEMFYHSGDRFAENINMYARGVNPMVSVEYGNSMKGNPTKLPYRIMNAGAFRPPQLRQEQLLALSRQPRNVTFVNTTKEFKDYSKSALCDQQPKCYRQVKPETLEGYILPTKTIKLQEPIKEHFEVKYIIQDPIYTDAFTNKNSLSNIQLENKEPLRQAIKEVNQYAYSSKVRGNNLQNYIHTDIELDRNMPFFNTDTAKSSTYKTNLNADYNMFLERNVPVHNVASNKTQNIHTVVDVENDLLLEKNVPMYNTSANKTQNIHTVINADNELIFEKNIPIHNATANRSQNIHTVVNADNELIFEKNIPQYNFAANLSDKTHYERVEPESHRVLEANLPTTFVVSNSNSNIKSAQSFELNRDVNLPQSLNIGGVSGTANMPMTERNIEYNSNYTTSKTRIADIIRNNK